MIAALIGCPSSTAEEHTKLAQQDDDDDKEINDEDDVNDVDCGDENDVHHLLQSSILNWHNRSKGTIKKVYDFNCVQDRGSFCSNS